MKRSRSAGFLLPLPADAALDADEGADQDAETDDGGTGGANGSDDAATGNSAEDASGATGAGTDTDTAGEEGDEDGGDVRNPRIKALSEEAKRWRLRVRELETELASRSADITTVQSLRIEKEFYRLAAARVTDLAAA